MSLMPILTLLFCFLYWRLAEYKKERLAKYISPELFTQDVPKRSWLAFIARALCLIVAWSLVSLSLMRFTFSQTAPQDGAKIELDEVAFFLDVSASMNVKDTATGASRLDRAKETIQSITETLGGVNVSLNAFAGVCQNIVPSTEDYLYFRILLDSLDGSELPVPGTNLSDVVSSVKKQYVDSRATKSVLVVLLTDGEDTGFLALSDKERGVAENTLISQIRKTASDTLQWDVCGLGSEKGGEVPGVFFNKSPVISSMKRELLERIAKAGEGRFYNEHTSSLSSLVDNILADVAVRQKESAPVVVESQAPLESNSLPIIGALFLILASLAVPQQVLRRQRA